MLLFSANHFFSTMKMYNKNIIKYFSQWNAFAATKRNYLLKITRHSEKTEICTKIGTRISKID